MKQKLKRALNEDRAGIQQSDPSVPLYTPRQEADGPAPQLQQKVEGESKSVRTIALLSVVLSPIPCTVSVVLPVGLSTKERWPRTACTCARCVRLSIRTYQLSCISICCINFSSFFFFYISAV